MTLVTLAACSDARRANPTGAVAVRRAPRATVRMNSGMSRLRSQTKTARSRVPSVRMVCVHARRSSGSGRRMMSSRRRRREDAPSAPRTDPRRPSPSTLSVGCITASPERAPDLRRPSMTAHECDRSRLRTTASPPSTLRRDPSASAFVTSSSRCCHRSPCVRAILTSESCFAR